MKADLTTQTRDLFSGVDERQRPIDLAEIMSSEAGVLAVERAVFEDAVSSKPVGRTWWRNVGVVGTAAAVVLLAVGGVGWLLGSVGSGDPANQTTITEPATSTSTTVSLSIVVPAPESLNRLQMEHQVEFLSAFQTLGLLGDGGCGGNDPGPYECSVAVYSPALGGPADIAYTVTDQDPNGRDPGEVSGPDDMQQGSLQAAAIRNIAEDGLASLYLWALATYPDATQRLCQSGFSGDDTYVAWNPGYVTSYECGAHLAGHLVEFSPAEAFPAQLLPPSETGTWYPVPGALEGASGRFDDALFDLTGTPYGIIGTSGQGLWISQDGTVWEPYARDTITYGPGCESWARVASSQLGVVVLEPCMGPHGWHTTDGTNWVEVGIPGFTDGGSVRIGATDDAFVIAAQGRIWRSTNGVEWAEIVVDAAVFADGIAQIWTLEATPFGFVAGGNEGSFPNRHSAIWHSVEGLLWTRATDLPQEPRLTDEGISDLAGSELGVVAVTTSGAIWFSPNAVNWTEVLTAPNRANETYSAVGASSSGFVVASDDRSSGIIKPQVLGSLDGTTWVVVGYITPGGAYDVTEDELGFGVYMREAIPLGNGFLIATEGAPSPVHIFEP